MRDPRPGLAWSLRRVTIRVRYATYMTSPAWHDYRRCWLQQWLADHPGADPTCAICRQPWDLPTGELHHRSYRHLGHEDHNDLTPLCHPCHQLLHTVLESTPAWRRRPRPQATDLIVNQLRANHTTRKQHP